MDVHVYMYMCVNYTLPNLLTSSIYFRFLASVRRLPRLWGSRA